MAKLKPEEVTGEDLIEFVASSGDFSFEMRILQMLRQGGLDCEHGGHYEDPVTRKSREFDIRATHTYGLTKTRLAVECKNIRANFPVLISCVRRLPFEAFHDVTAVKGDPHGARYAMEQRATPHRVSESSVYPIGEYVGKSIEQVGRDNAGFTANDSEVYEKWGQALASAQSLFDSIDDDVPPENSVGLRAVLPVVVIPDGRLWTVCYAEDGSVQEQPHLADRVPCYVNKQYTVGHGLGETQVTISHLEIVTQSGLKTLVERLKRDLAFLYPNKLQHVV